MKGLVIVEFLAAGGIGAGRLIPTAAAVVGLMGLLLGIIALRARAGVPWKRSAAIAGGASGFTSAVVGGLHVAMSAGGLGTGNGLAGAIVAFVLGLISLALCGSAIVRQIRWARSDGST